MAARKKVVRKKVARAALTSRLEKTWDDTRKALRSAEASVAAGWRLSWSAAASSPAR